jgi:hypothetical protein
MGVMGGAVSSICRNGPDESLRAIIVSNYLDGAMPRGNKALSAIIDSARNEAVTVINSARNDDADAE